MPGWMGYQLQNPFIGPTYPLNSRVGSVARTVNLVPRPLEPGNERTDWVFEDTIGLTAFATVNNIVASFIWTNALSVFSFVDTSQIDPVSWSWTFGDSGTSTAQNPVHEFMTDGTFTVTLTVANAAGKTSMVSHDVTVAGAPMAGLFYVDFNDGTATDQTVSPATPTVGAQAIIGDGYLKVVDPPTITAANQVGWAGSKFTAALADGASAFTMEGKVKFTTVPNESETGAGLLVFGLYETISSSFYTIAFAKSGPVLKFGIASASDAIETGVLSPNTEIHFALVIPAGALPTARLYSGSGATGTLIGTATVPNFNGAYTLSALAATNAANGPADWEIDWLRISLGELYTGSTYTIPTNT